MSISSIELIIAAILLIASIIIILIKKIPIKVKIIISTIFIIFSLCLAGHVMYNYFTEEPELVLNGNEQITLQANEKYIENGAKCTYHKKNISNNIDIIGKVDTNYPGTYTILYKYNYEKNKTKEIKRIITVEDKQLPVINLKGEKELNIYSDVTYKEPGYTAEDNVDHDLTKQVKVEKNIVNKNKYNLIYSVTDSSGNKAKAIRTINIKEREIKKADEEQNKGIIQNVSTTSNTSQVSSGPNSGIIYLTFDDGPSLDITPKILDVLKSENVKATFFILNYDANKEALVKREANEGHSIGIHGYSHDYNKIYQSIDTYMNNVTKLQNKIQKSTGITTYITRFPGGSSNTVSSFNPKIMTKLSKEVVKRGFNYYDWNVSSGDAGGGKTRNKIYKNVVNSLKRNQSNIVLMHDFAGNNPTLDALQAIIQYGKQNGYTFRAITKNTPMIVHGINN